MKSLTAVAQDDEFFPALRRASEEAWRDLSLNGSVVGFQVQPGTRWLPGLAAADIASYEAALGLEFPEVYRAFLSHMNGTDLPAVNLYGSSGYPVAYTPGYYSYPRDLDAVLERIAWIYEEFGVTAHVVVQRQIPRIIPVIAHRFLVAGPTPTNPVLSMYGRDVVVYASSLRQFLWDDVFNAGRPSESDALNVEVPFWLEEDPAEAPPD